MKRESHCGLSDMQKAIVISFATVFIDDESGGVDKVLENIIDILEYSYEKYQRNLPVVIAMIDVMGLDLLNKLKNVSATDKDFIKEAIDYSYNYGGNKNPQMYNTFLLTLGFADNHRII